MLIKQVVNVLGLLIKGPNSNNGSKEEIGDVASMVEQYVSACLCNILSVEAAHKGALMQGAVALLSALCKKCWDIYRMGVLMKY